jgi:hypothetical protein
MQLEHLTDEEIQDYLDENLSGKITLLVRQHLEGCHRCREALKQYQSVYVGLEDEKGFELSKVFARSVVNKLPAEGEAKSYFSFLNIFLALLGLAISIGITLRYVNLKPLGKALSHVLPGPELGSGLLDLMKGLLLGLNGNLGFVAFALLTLLLVAGLDRLVFQPRHRRLRT